MIPLTLSDSLDALKHAQFCRQFLALSAGVGGPCRRGLAVPEWEPEPAGGDAPEWELDGFQQRRAEIEVTKDRCLTRPEGGLMSARKMSKLLRVLVPVGLVAMALQATTPAFSDSYEDEMAAALDSNAERNQALEFDDAPTTCGISPRDELENSFAGTGTGNRRSVYRQVEINPADEAKFVVDCVNRTSTENFFVTVTIQYQYFDGSDWVNNGSLFTCRDVFSTGVGLNRAAKVTVAPERGADCDPLVLQNDDIGRSHSAEILVYVDEVLNTGGFAFPWTPGTPACGADLNLGEQCDLVTPLGL